jgi:hypothetical protein
MAIVVEMLVPQASKAEADEFEAVMERAMMERGGLPAGLMMHLARPDGDGVLLVNVWRNEAEMRALYDEVILPRLADAGLEAGAPTVSPVWTFARP